MLHPAVATFGPTAEKTAAIATPQANDCFASSTGTAAAVSSDDSLLSTAAAAGSASESNQSVAATNSSGATGANAAATEAAATAKTEAAETAESTAKKSQTAHNNTEQIYERVKAGGIVEAVHTENTAAEKEPPTARELEAAETEAAVLSKATKKAEAGSAFERDAVADSENKKRAAAAVKRDRRRVGKAEDEETAEAFTESSKHLHVFVEARNCPDSTADSMMLSSQASSTSLLHIGAVASFEINPENASSSQHADEAARTAHAVKEHIKAAETALTAEEKAIRSLGEDVADVGEADAAAVSGVSTVAKKKPLSNTNSAPTLEAKDRRSDEAAAAQAAATTVAPEEDAIKAADSLSSKEEEEVTAAALVHTSEVKSEEFAAALSSKLHAVALTAAQSPTTTTTAVAAPAETAEKGAWNSSFLGGREEDGAASVLKEKEYRGSVRESTERNSEVERSQTSFLGLRQIFRRRNGSGLEGEDERREQQQGEKGETDAEVVQQQLFSTAGGLLWEMGRRISSSSIAAAEVAAVAAAKAASAAAGVAVGTDSSTLMTYSSSRSSALTEGGCTHTDSPGTSSDKLQPRLSTLKLAKHNSPISRHHLTILADGNSEETQQLENKDRYSRSHRFGGAHTSCSPRTGCPASEDDLMQELVALRQQVLIYHEALAQLPAGGLQSSAEQQRGQIGKSLAEPAEQKQGKERDGLKQSEKRVAFDSPSPLNSSSMRTNSGDGGGGAGGCVVVGAYEDFSKVTSSLKKEGGERKEKHSASYLSATAAAGELHRELVELVSEAAGGAAATAAATAAEACMQAFQRGESQAIDAAAVAAATSVSLSEDDRLLHKLQEVLQKYLGAIRDSPTVAPGTAVHVLEAPLHQAKEVVLLASERKPLEVVGAASAAEQESKQSMEEASSRSSGDDSSSSSSLTLSAHTGASTSQATSPSDCCSQRSSKKDAEGSFVTEAADRARLLATIKQQQRELEEHRDVNDRQTKQLMQLTLQLASMKTETEAKAAQKQEEQHRRETETTAAAAVVQQQQLEELAAAAAESFGLKCELQELSRLYSQATEKHSKLLEELSKVRAQLQQQQQEASASAAAKTCGVDKLGREFEDKTATLDSSTGIEQNRRLLSVEDEAEKYRISAAAAAETRAERDEGVDFAEQNGLLPAQKTMASIGVQTENLIVEEQLPAKTEETSASAGKLLVHARERLDDEMMLVHVSGARPLSLCGNPPASFAAEVAASNSCPPRVVVGEEAQTEAKKEEATTEEAAADTELKQLRIRVAQLQFEVESLKARQFCENRRQHQQVQDLKRLCCKERKKREKVESECERLMAAGLEHQVLVLQGVDWTDADEAGEPPGVDGGRRSDDFEKIQKQSFVSSEGVPSEDFSALQERSNGTEKKRFSHARLSAKESPFMRQDCGRMQDPGFQSETFGLDGAAVAAGQCNEKQRLQKNGGFSALTNNNVGDQLASNSGGAAAAVVEIKRPLLQPFEEKEVNSEAVNHHKKEAQRSSFADSTFGEAEAVTGLAVTNASRALSDASLDLLKEKYVKAQEELERLSESQQLLQVDVAQKAEMISFLLKKYAVKEEHFRLARPTASSSAWRSICAAVSSGGRDAREGRGLTFEEMQKFVEKTLAENIRLRADLATLGLEFDRVLEQAGREEPCRPTPLKRFDPEKMRKEGENELC